MAKRGSFLLIGALKDAYKAGILRFIEDPNGYGTVCSIGDNWFYFNLGECYKPDELLRCEGLRDSLESVHDALEGKGGMKEVDRDEYDYYIAVLKESVSYRPIN